MRTRLLVLLCFGIAFPLFSQTDEARIAFDVASVKMAGPPQAGHGGNRSTHDGIEYLSMPLRLFLCNAFRVHDFQIVGPDWLRDQPYDIVAKMAPGGDVRKIPQMMQTLLAERFQMKIHRETRGFQGYALVVGPGGPKLQPSTGDSAGPLRAALGDIPAQPVIHHMMRSDGSMHLTCDRVPLSYFLSNLSLQLGVPLVDETNLTGTYNFEVDIAADDRRSDNLGTGEERRPSALPSDTISVFASVQRLGLKLKPQKVPLEVIVVDHIERIPTAN